MERVGTVPIEIHGNLNRRVMTTRIRRTGERVTHRLDTVAVVADATFRVRPAGHRRATGTREVCAHVVGELDSITPTTRDDYAGARDWVQVTYDPKTYPERDYFYRADTGERVEWAPYCVCVAVASSTSRTRLAVYVPRAVL